VDRFANYMMPITFVECSLAHLLCPIQVKRRKTQINNLNILDTQYSTFFLDLKSFAQARCMYCRFFTLQANFLKRMTQQIQIFYYLMMLHEVRYNLFSLN
jgi:hypothetical protein